MAGRPRVVVTGMGVVTSVAHDVAGFTLALKAGRSGVARLSRPPLNVGADISDFDFAALAQRTPTHAATARRLGARAPFAVQASIVATLEAWTQARLHEDAVPPERIGLVVAGNNTTRAYQHALEGDFARDPEYLSPRYALQYQDSNQLGVLSELLGLKGEAFVCGAASASGAVGLIQAMRLIRAGAAQACMVVGVLADLSPMEWRGYHNIGALGGKSFADDPTRACRPFDAAHEGFIPGQAVAALMLESGESAEARGAPDFCEILGGCVALHASASSDPSRDGEGRAMAGALRDAGLAPSDIDYVNTHGTSSPRGDIEEIAALAALFGEHFPNVWLNSTKSLIGHCLTSAGAIETVAAVVQMRAGFLHANLNLDDPIDTRARFCGPVSTDVASRIVLKNSFGFGGINASLVLRRSGP